MLQIHIAKIYIFIFAQFFPRRKCTELNVALLQLDESQTGKYFRADCVSQIVRGDAIFFTLFSRPRYDEAVSTVVPKSHGPELLLPTFAFDNLPYTSNLRLKHSAPFVRPPLRSFLLPPPQPRNRRLKHELDRPDCAIEGAGVKGG